MDNKSTTSQEQEKSAVLISAVACKAPDEVREVYKSLGKVEFTAEALACACRYKGLEYVKALVECGASFNYDSSDVTHTYAFYLSLIDFNNKRSKSFYMDVLSDMEESVFDDHLQVGGGKKLPVLPLKERIRIAEYLCQNAESAGFDSGELLYYSILTKNFTMADALKRAGAVLSDKYKKLLSQGSRGVENGTDLWYEYCMILGNPYGDDIIRLLEYLSSALGDMTLHFTDTIYSAIGSRDFYDPELFEFFLSVFNQSKMNKSKMLKVMIKNDLIADLEIAAASGWLKQPRKRDEMIAYAAENGCTEASAWLLDYKNRTADLAAEQEKAEKKMMRELNAAPDSVSELKKAWSYKKREDGTLVITSYKGNKEEITVPAKIGKEDVTAVGAYAFSPSAPRRTQQQADNRAKIRKIVLPDSVKVIEECAFYWCKCLEEVNIPDGVTEICKSTFADSGIRSLTIPDSVRAIAEGAFAACSSLEKINLPEGIPEIAEYTFSACRALKEIEIPGSAEKIGKWAFQSCISLERAVIHEGVAEIGRQAFSRCEALKELELPASIGKIKNYRYPKGPAVTPFEKIPDITFTVTPKSYAEKYCKRNELNYKIK